MSESRASTHTALQQTSQYNKIRNELFAEICVATITQDIAKLNYLLMLPNASLHMRRSDGAVPVYQLAKSGEAPAVEWLVDKFNASLNEAVMGAAQGGHEDLVVKLLKKGAEIAWAIEGYGRAGNTDKARFLISCDFHRIIAVRAYAYAGLKDEVDHYLQHGIDPIHAYGGYIRGRHFELIPNLNINEHIIRAYASVAQHDEIQKHKYSDFLRGWAIYAYAQIGEIDAVEELSINNDDLNFAIWGYALSGHIELANTYLKRGASKDYGARGYAQAGNIEQVNVFIKKHGVDAACIIAGLNDGHYLQNANSILKMLALIENTHVRTEIINHLRSTNKNVNSGLLYYQSSSIKRIIHMENKWYQEAKDLFETRALDKRLHRARELIAYSLALDDENIVDSMIIKLACFKIFWRSKSFEEFEAISEGVNGRSVSYYFMKVIHSLNHNISLLQIGKSVKSIEADVKHVVHEFQRYYETLTPPDKTYLARDLKFSDLSLRLFELLSIELNERLIYLVRAALRAFYWSNERQLKRLFPGSIIKNELCLDILDFKKESTDRPDIFGHYRQSIDCSRSIRECFGTHADEVLLKVYPDKNSILTAECFSKELIDLLGLKILCRYFNSMESIIALFQDITPSNAVIYLIDKLHGCGHIPGLLKMSFTENETYKQSINAIRALPENKRTIFLKMIHGQVSYYLSTALQQVPDIFDVYLPDVWSKQYDVFLSWLINMKDIGMISNNVIIHFQRKGMGLAYHMARVISALSKAYMISDKNCMHVLTSASETLYFLPTLVSNLEFNKIATHTNFDNIMKLDPFYLKYLYYVLLQLPSHLNTQEILNILIDNHKTLYSLFGLLKQEANSTINKESLISLIESTKTSAVISTNPSMKR